MSGVNYEARRGIGVKGRKIAQNDKFVKLIDKIDNNIHFDE